MTTTAVSLCIGCQHLHREGSPLTSPPINATRTTWQPSCAAFPTGIPAEVADGSVDHRQAYLGDHGIRFVEMIEGTVTAYDTRPQRTRRKP